MFGGDLGPGLAGFALAQEVAGGFFRFRAAVALPGIGSVTLPSLKSFAKQISYPRALFPDSYCAQAGPSEGASRGVVKRDRLAVAAHGCNTHTQRTAVQAARSRRDRFATPGLLTSAP